MKFLSTTIAALCLSIFAFAQSAEVTSPDGRIKVTVTEDATYSITLDAQTILQPSALGLKSNRGDFTVLKLKGSEIKAIESDYELDRIKKSAIHYTANALSCKFENSQGSPITVEMRVSDSDVALRYTFDRSKFVSIRVFEEATAFNFPSNTTTFLTPQSDAMIGFKRSKPSYEEYYTADAPLTAVSQYGHGYTFPCLFKVGDSGWALVGETGVDSHYCGSHLSDWQEGGYRIAFPMAEENDGNGTLEPAFACPGATPWRTITVGTTLAPIAESTVTWDVVDQLYEPSMDYQYGKSTWSWILWQDASSNYDDQVRYIDLAAAMGYKYTLVDAFWDQTIGYERMKQLSEYARSKGVELFLWYSSSGYWNDIEQTPANKMDTPIARKAEMKWLREIGVKGIKVDFFGGDKQETIRLYDAILSDANDYGLMVIFHGCTMPRGWERMYPNYVGSEAIRASENLIFGQHECDIEAFQATLHPFIRNAQGCMEFGGVFLNKVLSKTQERGSIRRTTDDFELATAVLFQNPIQNFALAPNNLEDAPAYCLDFMREVPTTWDDIKYIDGYPGKYAVIARRHGDTWHVGAINADATPYQLDIRALAETFGASDLQLLHAGACLTPVLNLKAKSGTKAYAKANVISLPANDGAVLILK